MLIKTNNLQVN